MMKTYYIKKDDEGNIESVYSRPQTGLDLEQVPADDSELQLKFDSENTEYERSKLIQARANEILKRQAETELISEGIIS